MCGISGILALNGNLTSSDCKDGEEMTQLLNHRGPDYRGLLKDKKCYLGNTRLKIIDLSDKANLPMSNSKGDVWLAYNGEVTNFLELKKKFNLDTDFDIKTSSDTEILICLYEKLGIDFINELSGMFAFCLYDKNNKKAYVVRDQYGTRPLFYMKKNDKLYFSSEIKSFLILNSFNNEIDHEAIYHYFSLGYIPGTLTPFKDIKELDGSHLLKIDFKNGKIIENEYYKLNFITDYSMTEKDAVKGFYNVMLDSVRRNLVSDVPIGLTLSGGLDSSSILALIKELGKSQEIHTFSLKINSPSFDESRYQRIMSKHAGSIHHEVVINAKEIIDNLHQHMAYMDEPVADGSAIPNFLLSKEAQKHVKVLLSGEGGDEISNAYETHRAYKLAKVYRKFTPFFVRKIIGKISKQLPTSYNKLSFDFLAKRFSEGCEKNPPEAHLYWRHVLDLKEKKALLLHNDFRNTESLFEDLFNNSSFNDELNKIGLIDFKYFFIGDLMLKNDRMLMAHSVEARFPYVDRAVVEFTSKIPTKYKIKGFKHRYFQKEAMKPLLPFEIYSRKNFGIEIPYSIWFLNEFKTLGEKYFSKENIEKTGLFNFEFIYSMWKQHQGKIRDNGRFLWSLLIFLVWYDMYVVNKDFKKYLNLEQA